MGYGKSVLTIIVAVGLLMAHHEVGASIIDTYPSWDGNVTRDWNKTAQTFTMPTDGPLYSWEFALAPRANGGTVELSIFEWSNLQVSPVGDALFRRDLAWPEAGGNVLVSAMNLGLVPGQVYAAVIDMRSHYLGDSVHYMFADSYSGGRAYWWKSDAPGIWSSYGGMDHKFRAQFGSTVPEPTSLVAFASLSLTGIGLAAWKRRRKPQPAAA